MTTRFTQKRLRDLEPVLTKFRELLEAKGQFSTDRLDMALREVFGETSFAGVNEIVEKLLELPSGRFVALYMMQFGQGPEFVKDEFKRDLEEAYGVDHYDPNDIPRYQEFWRTFPEHRGTAKLKGPSKPR